MVWRVLRREAGQPWTGINHKRVQRLWREEGLRRPVRTRKRRRVATGTAERLRATHPNHVWAIDFEFDETADGRRLKLANIVDEHTREALAMRVGRRCTADDLVNATPAPVGLRGPQRPLTGRNGLRICRTRHELDGRGLGPARRPTNSGSRPGRSSGGQCH